MNKHIALSIPGMLAVATLTSCSQGQQTDAAYNSAPGEYPVYTLQTGPATIRPVYPASPEGQQNIEIRPKVDGYIQQIFVDEGTLVKKGQLLFKLHAPQYEQVNDQLEQWMTVLTLYHALGGDWQS